MQIHKIVITGGPCAGKTTALSWIQNAFTKRGYRVLFVPETATELISGGVAPWTCGTNLDYQLCQMRLQLEKEAVFEQAAKTMRDEKILIVCDRGALDNRAYMTDEEFARVLAAIKTNEVTLRDTYDAVFHLETAAKGALEAYTLANNAARTETPEQACELDDRLISAWSGHPHLRIIDNSTDFQEKLERTIAEIASFLGDPEPFEIERKFLIKKPDLQWLSSLPGCTKVEIEQTYLLSPSPDTQIRIRRRGSDSNYIFFRSEKRRITPVRRVEVEQRLSEDEYNRLLADADPSARTIRKERYCLPSNHLYYEIDIYPEWKDQAILELELCSEADEVLLPDGIQVIREVTDDERYRNYALAHHMLAEEAAAQPDNPEMPIRM